MDEKSSRKIEEKLDIIIKLLCSKYIEGKSKTDSILLLESVGIDRDLICELTGSTPASVRSTISTAKKMNEKDQSKKKFREARPNEQSQ